MKERIMNESNIMIIINNSSFYNVYHHRYLKLDSIWIYTIRIPFRSVVKLKSHSYYWYHVILLQNFLSQFHSIKTDVLSDDTGKLLRVTHEIATFLKALGTMHFVQAQFYAIYFNKRLILVATWHKI